MTDATTFFLAFSAVAGGIAWYAFILNRRVADLQQRLDELEASNAPTTLK